MKTDPNDSVTGFFSPECGTVAGLTKREYFAGQIVAALSQEAYRQGMTPGTTPIYITQMAVNIADGLIKKLNEEK